ncbi:hypothetical protein LSTR_LSTR008076, partial [Laodelphax striatellus]
VITVLILLVFAVESSPPYQYFYNPHSGQFEVSYQSQPHNGGSHHPSYSFNYGVRDPLTGDVKSQWEQRDGDLVQGHYSVIDPDGSLRSVHYTSGRNSGYKKLRGSIGWPVTTVAKPLIAYGKPIKSIYKSTLSLPGSQFPNLPSLPAFPSWYFTGDIGNSLVQPEVPPPSQVHNPGPVLFPQNPADDTTVTPDPNQTSGVTPPPPQFIPPKSHESLRDQIFRRPETLPQPSPQPPAISQLTSNLLYTPATFAYVRK